MKNFVEKIKTNILTEGKVGLLVFAFSIIIFIVYLIKSLKCF